MRVIKSSFLLIFFCPVDIRIGYAAIVGTC